MYRSIRRDMVQLGLLAIIASLTVLVGPTAAGASSPSPGYAARDFVVGMPNANNIGPVGLAFDATNHLWVMDYSNGLLYKFDGSGGVADAAHQITVGASPWGPGNAAGIAFSKSGRLYVALQRSNRVDEVSLTDGQIVRTVASAGCATGIATDPASGDLVVTDPCPGPSTRIHDPDSPTPVVSQQMWPYWSDGLSFVPDGSIWSTYYGNYLVHVVNGSPTDETVYVPGGPDGTAVSTVDGAVFANTNAGTVVRFDTATHVQTNIFSGGSRGDFSTVGPDGCLYITQTDRIVRISDDHGGCPFAPTTALPVMRLTPSTQSPHVGETAAITATLKNVQQPLGTVVTFTVTGANPGTFTGTADASGIVIATYKAAAQGIDTVAATTKLANLEVASNSTTVDWQPALDATPPVITPTITGTRGAFGWYTSPVTVSFAAADPESGVASTNGCDTVTFSVDTPSASITCTATNGVGLKNSDTEIVKIDQTAPTVGFSGNAGTYSIDQTVAITCSANDAMSGVASSTCANVNGPAWSLGVGSHTISASASDVAGNVGSSSTRYTVVVTAPGLCALTQAWTTQAAIADALCDKLDRASTASASGQVTTAQNILNAFRNQVAAQRGKAITTTHADELALLSFSL